MPHTIIAANSRTQRRLPPRTSNVALQKSTRGRESGFVTAELAVILPIVIAFIALAMWAQAAVGTKVQIIDAAHSAALAAARGDDPHEASAAQRPPDATVTIRHTSTTVTATVTTTITPLGPLAPSKTIQARSTAARQDLHGFLPETQ